MSEVLSVEYQSMAANAIAHAASMAGESVQQVAWQHGTPSAVYRPRISIDGNQWCALYGDDLQKGVCGFGDSPGEAMADFDKNWRAKLPAKGEQK